MTEPRTEAGKALYASKMRPTRATIRAIEEQAATEAIANHDCRDSCGHVTPATEKGAPRE